MYQLNITAQLNLPSFLVRGLNCWRWRLNTALGDQATQRLLHHWTSDTRMDSPTAR